MYNIRQYHIADALKSAYIDYILEHFDNNVIIGHEVMYGSRGRFADLVVLYKGFTYAIEIKSDADSMQRIDNQLNAYKKIFNYVIVVCGEKHKNYLKNNLPQGVGLFVITNSYKIKRILRPKRETSTLDKKEMLFSIRSSYLAQKADFPVAKLDTDAVLAQYAKKRTSYIQEILYNYWYLKLGPAFAAFMSNRGCQTLPADLANFTTFRVLPNV